MKIKETPSPNFNERSRALDSIILHYTDMLSADEALKWLCNPVSKVSAHYLIGEDGQTYQLVDEENRAWHAGESFWQGRTDLNSCSVGIELANPGHSFGYRTFPEAQIDALISLCEGIMSRWSIAGSRILGHSDVAPRRKQDPGHLFPWERLANAGMGLWPSPNGRIDDGSITESLAQIGYEIISPTDALLAFQRHFQPHKVDGVADNETIALIQGLLRSQEKLI
jgi:N-acetylmuramoyl-L-alanine amidase